MGADLDKIIDASGALLPWTDDVRRKQSHRWAAVAPDPAEILARLKSYAERSPSTTGARALVYGTIPKGINSGGFEAYFFGRYLTITGDILTGMPRTLRRCGDELATLVALFDRAGQAKKDAAEDRQNTAWCGFSPDDQRIIAIATNADNGAKFEMLFRGDASAYKSQSEADLAFCSILAFWVGPDADRIDQIFRQSGLMTDKWGRPDYRAATIDTALSGCRNFYDWTRGNGAAAAEDSATEKSAGMRRHTIADLTLAPDKPRTTAAKIVVPVDFVRQGDPAPATPEP